MLTLFVLIAVGYGIYFFVKKQGGNEKSPPTPAPEDYLSVMQRAHERAKKREFADVEKFDVGTAEERYDRAGKLWDTKEPEAQKAAMSIYKRMIDEGVPYGKPYHIYSNILIHSDAQKNSGEVLELRKKALEIEPKNATYRANLQDMFFIHAKICWDKENLAEAFDAYIEGLNMYTDSGETLDQSSALTVRIAFRACRMFSKDALENGNPDLGVRFCDWCEKAGVDMNEDIDISDAQKV